MNNLIKVGIRHFKSEAKIIRAEPITFISGLKDIIDNVYGLSKENEKKYEQRIQFKIDADGNIYQIIISDSVEHGLKNIDKNGEKNPLNMGHIRDEHDDNNTTSEFGVGMKKTFIYTSHKTTVYTKCVNENGTKYYKIEFDFRDMCLREEAINSYEPALFETITQEQFLNKKPDDIGSIIILEELIPSALGNLNLKEYSDRNSFLNSIKSDLGVTYRDVIGKHIDIYVGEDKVEPSRDMKQIDNLQRFLLYVKLDDRKEPKNMYYHNVNTNTWFSFDKTKKNVFSNIPKKDIDENMIIRDYYLIKVFFCDDYNNGEGDSTLNAMTEMVRDGRSFGKVKITKTQNDGYSNYIYSRVEWLDKKLNGLFGVSSSKTIVKRDGDLYSALAYILKKPETDTRKKRKLEPETKKRKEEKNKSDDEDTEDDEDIPMILPVKDNKVSHKVDKNIQIIGEEKQELDIEEEFQPVIEEEFQPVIEEEFQPVIEEEFQPVIEEEFQPVIEDFHPVIEEVQPVIEEVQPVIEEVQPVIEEVQPVIEEVQPVIEEVQPVIDPYKALISRIIDCDDKDKIKRIVERMARQIHHELLDQILTQAQV